MCLDHIPKPVEGVNMILKEETYEKFGYYPSDLKPHSHKKVISICDKCEKIKESRKQDYRPYCPSCARKGKRFTEEHKNKIRETHKGEKNPFWGRHHSKKQIEKWSKERKGENNGNYGRCHTKQEKERMRKARKCRFYPKHHTDIELIFEKICKKHNLPFKYTGDGSFWIGKNPSINPDFIECNSKKVAVEIFGDYWHSPLLNYKLKEDRTLPYRKKVLKKYGWELIVFWQSDLLREDAEQFILLQLSKY